MRPTAARCWWLAARPKTLWAGVVPVLVGTAVAMDLDAFHGPSAALCLAVALCMQIGANFANDYFDFIKGTDTGARIGPTRATQAGWISTRQMRNAFILAFGLAIAGCAWLAVRGGSQLMWIGVAGAAAGILYTGGPFPLGYNGLGDLFAFVFFGPVAAAGTAYVQAGTLTAEMLIAGVAPGLLAVAMITVNNLRDIVGDRDSGKRTLPVLLGAGFARWEYLTAVAGAAAVPVCLVWRTQAHAWVLASSLLILAATPSVRRVFDAKSTGAQLNEVLAATGKLMLLYGVLFAAGWLL